MLRIGPLSSHVCPRRPFAAEAQRRSYLFEARRHAPAAGLHDAVIAAHVLADLPVLLTPLLSACQHCRVTEERRNTVTGQSGSNGRETREREKVCEALAARQPAGGAAVRKPSSA